MAVPAELIDFIRKGFSKGIAREQITRVLLENHWEIEDINAGFNEFLYANVTPAPGTPMPVVQVNAEPAPVQATQYVPDNSPKQRTSAAIVSTSIFLGILIILGGTLMFTQNLWVPTAVSTVNRVEGSIDPRFFGNPTPASQIPATTTTPGQTEGVQVDGTTVDTLRESDIQTIQKALGAYFDNQNTYPDSLNELAPNYLQIIPTDPFTHEPYTYSATDQGIDFTLCAFLSNNTNYCADQVGDYTTS